MRSGVRMVLVAVGSAALVMCGVGISAATGGGSSSSGSTVKALPARVNRPRASVPTPDEAVFVPIVPCRVVDTRIKGGAVSQARSFYVDGTANFPVQGGKSGGCGIPLGADAIAADIHALGSAKAGNVYAYPAGAAAPTATALNYGAKQTISNGLSLAVRPGATQGVTVSASAPVQIVIDVTGYYEPQISGYVTYNGALDTATSRVLSVSHTANTGEYSITIDREVVSCTVALTIGGSGAYAGGYDASGDVLTVFTWHLSSTATAVATDAEFNFSIVC